MFIIKDTNFHNIIVDETSDVTNKEHAAFCVCWVDENLFSSFIKDIILQLGFDSKQLLVSLRSIYENYQKLEELYKKRNTKIEKQKREFFVSKLR